MTSRYIRTATVVDYPLDNFRSFPAAVGTTGPLNPVQPARQMEYPQETSLTAPDLAIPASGLPGWRFEFPYQPLTAIPELLTPQTVEGPGYGPTPSLSSPPDARSAPAEPESE